MNGVIETSSGNLLRFGETDFSADGSFNAVIETLRFDIPSDAIARGERGAALMSRWTGTAWEFVAQPYQATAPEQQLILLSITETLLRSDDFGVDDRGWSEVLDVPDFGPPYARVVNAPAPTLTVSGGELHITHNPTGNLAPLTMIGNNGAAEKLPTNLTRGNNFVIGITTKLDPAQAVVGGNSTNFTGVGFRGSVCDVFMGLFSNEDGLGDAEVAVSGAFNPGTGADPTWADPPIALTALGGTDDLLSGFGGQEHDLRIQVVKTSDTLFDVICYFRGQEAFRFEAQNIQAFGLNTELKAYPVSMGMQAARPHTHAYKSIRIWQLPGTASQQIATETAAGVVRRATQATVNAGA